MRKGVPVSPGVAVARAYCVDEILARREPKHLDTAALSDEVIRFDRACAAAARDLDAIVARVRQQVGEAEAGIFQAHRLLLRDPALIARVRSAILDRHVDARTALHELLDEYAQLFARIDNEYLKERMADLRDVVGRILGQIAFQEGHHVIEASDPVVLVAPEILPSQAMSFEKLKLA